MSVPGRSLQDTMTSRIAPLYGFCTALLTFLVCTSIASAQNPQGGFFEKDFATKGFFDEPKQEETPKEGPATLPTPLPEGEQNSEDSFAAPDPAPSEAPPPGTPTESPAVAAHDIISHTRSVISSAQRVQQNPELMQQIKEGVAGTREAVLQEGGVPGNLPNTNLPQDTARISPPIPRNPAERASLSVIVRAEPRQGFLKVLERLLVAKSKYGIELDEIYVLGKSKDIALRGLLNGELLKGLKKYLDTSGMRSEQIASLLGAVKDAIPSGALVLDRLKVEPEQRPPDVAALVQKFKLEYSPAWIVRAGGRYHVFQGNYDVVELFQANGEFIGETLP